MNVGMNTTASRSAASATPSTHGLIEAVGGLESGLHDARSMAAIVSLLIEDGLTRADENGWIRLGEQHADAITWAVYNVESLIKKAQREWDEANTIAHELRRAAR